MSDKLYSKFRSVLSRGDSKSGRSHIVSIILVLILIGMIFYSLGSSETSDLNSSGEVSYATDPSQGEGLPTLPNGPFSDMNLTDMPDVTNIPTGPPPTFPPTGGGNNVTQGPNPTFSTSLPSSLPSSIPTISSISIPSISSVTAPSTINVPSSFTDFPTGPDTAPTAYKPPSFDVPLLPSRYRYFPSFNLSSVDNMVFDLNGLRFGISINSHVLFYGMILALPVLILLSLPHVLAMSIKELDKELEQAEKREEKRRRELEKRKELERRRRLIHFSDYIQKIIEDLSSMIGVSPPEEIIVQGYHLVDDAFSHFSQLRREEGITPLEHAFSVFQSGEIDNEVLKEIVGMFYEVRFGERSSTKEDTHHFIELLGKLVIEEAKYREVKS